MAVGEWRLPAAGQGRVCAGTLGLLLDPGGGAVESYCRGGGGGAEQGQRGLQKRPAQSSQHLLLFEGQLGDPHRLNPSLGLSFQRFTVRQF